MLLILLLSLPIFGIFIVSFGMLFNLSKLEVRHIKLVALGVNLINLFFFHWESSPKPHSFTSLPLQSKFSLISLKKNILATVKTKKFWYSLLVIFVTGFLSRFIIKYYGRIDVFTDIFNIISITYYLTFGIWTILIRQLFTDLFKNAPLGCFTENKTSLKNLMDIFKGRSSRMYLGGGGWHFN